MLPCNTTEEAERSLTKELRRAEAVEQLLQLASLDKGAKLNNSEPSTSAREVWKFPGVAVHIVSGIRKRVIEDSIHRAQFLI